MIRTLFKRNLSLLIKTVNPDSPIGSKAGLMLPWLEGHKAIIYKPGKDVLTSGSSHLKNWKFRFSYTLIERSDSLMGYIASGDPVGFMELEFSTRESAIKFAEKHDLPYEVDDPPDNFKKDRLKYGDEFKWKGLAKTPDDDI